MQPIFKALASVSAWILFIVGCLTYIITLVVVFSGGSNGERFMETVFFIAFGTAAASVSIIASVVAMKLRHTME